MVRKKHEEKQEEQSRRFIEDARKLGCDEDPKTFERAVRKVATADPPPEERKSEATWFVAYSLLPGPRSRAGQGERLGRFFDEEEAKKYAKQIAIDPKLRIRAGTLPEIMPSSQIEPAEIKHWLKKSHG